MRSVLSFVRIASYIFRLSSLFVLHPRLSISNKGMSTLADASDSVGRSPRALEQITLITFDVDGTLLRGNPNNAEEASLHAKAFLYAAGKVIKNVDDFHTKYTSPLDWIPHERYHGCTDGLIMLNLVKNAFGTPVDIAAPKLPELFQNMYDFMAQRTDEELATSTLPIPGVIETLSKLSKDENLKGKFLCGLVTGNVEGIARKKLRACGILKTGVMTNKAMDQNWKGEEDAAFLGGFGSDYCSCDIDDQSRLYKDRGEQICIAYQRARSLLSSNQRIARVVHVGDAPTDVLAAKYCCDEQKFPPGVIVSCVGVATGKFSAQSLLGYCGVGIPNKWEPVVLEAGISDPRFISCCKIGSNISLN